MKLITFPVIKQGRLGGCKIVNSFNDMIEINNQTFEEFYDEDSGEVFENIIFNRCKFNYCDISQTNNPEYRSTVKNVELNNCVAKGGSIGNAIIQDVTINNFRNTGLIQTWGAVFRRVTMKGNLGRIMITNSIFSPDEEVNNAFKEENKLFYSDTDWALDISEANFIEIDIRGIPVDLIRINPEYQAIIRKENIPDNWESLNFKDSVTFIVIGHLLGDTDSDGCVYNASTRTKGYQEILEDIELLRKVGIADK